MIDGLPWWSLPGVAALLFAALSLLVLLVLSLICDVTDWLNGKGRR